MDWAPASSRTHDDVQSSSSASFEEGPSSASQGQQLVFENRCTASRVCSPTAGFRQRSKSVKGTAQFEPISFDLDALSAREEQQWRRHQRLGSPLHSRVGRLGLSPRPQEKLGLPSASLPTALPYPASQPIQFWHSSENTDAAGSTATSVFMPSSIESEPSDARKESSVDYRLAIFAVGCLVLVLTTACCVDFKELATVIGIDHITSESVEAGLWIALSIVTGGLVWSFHVALFDMDMVAEGLIMAWTSGTALFLFCLSHHQWLSSRIGPFASSSSALFLAGTSACIYTALSRSRSDHHKRE